MRLSIVSSFNSSHWRYQAFTNNFDRLMSSETPEQSTGSFIQDRLNKLAEANFAKRMMVEDFLSQLIGSGEEREKYQELVKKFSDAFNSAGALTEVDDYYQYVSPVCFVHIIHSPFSLENFQTFLFRRRWMEMSLRHLLRSLKISSLTILKITIKYSMEKRPALTSKISVILEQMVQRSIKKGVKQIP